MRKKLLSLAFAALSCVAFSATAQNNGCDKAECKCSPCDCPASCATTCDSTACKACCDSACKPFDRKAICKTGKGCDLFAGLTLTDSQKAQLRDLKARRDSVCASKAKVMRDNRASRDSMRIDIIKAEKRKYLDEVKAILGADQYVTFLENYYLYTPKIANARKMRSHNFGRHTARMRTAKTDIHRAKSPYARHGKPGELKRKTTDDSAAPMTKSE